MIKSTVTLTEVKQHIMNMSKKPVEVTINLGRNKYVQYRGTLSGVYPALFTVVPDDSSFKGKTSYSYSEFMCGKVRLNVSAEQA